MKAKNIVSFVLVMLIIVAMTVVVIGDFTIAGIKVPSILDKDAGVNKGIDIDGGSVIVFEPDVSDLSAVTDEEMSAAEMVVRSRLDNLSVDGVTFTEATIARQGDSHIRVEIPGIEDPNDAVAVVGQMASLTFNSVVSDGTYIYPADVVMEGTAENVKSAVSTYGPVDEIGSMGYYVQLELTSAGQELFRQATAAAAAQPVTSGMNRVAICLDGMPYSMPFVEEEIDSTTCVINGLESKEVADNLANVINSGRLPFSLNVAELRSVGPTLGEEALNTSLFAALIGVILVMLFMLVIYRLPGLVADVSLVAYIGVVCLIMTGFYHHIPYVTTLTLPGIAGVILSIGMAVDANVVIFERIKDELNSGKSVGASVDSGFKRALTAVIDSNITTLISCVVLYFFGTGTIKSFAETLFIGVIVSLITAVFLTKFLLKRIVGFGVKNPWFYGASKRRDA